MKRKIINVLFALVLVLSLTLVVAVPATATAPVTFNVVPFSLYAGTTNGTAAWSTAHYKTGSSSVLLTHHATNVGSDYLQFVPDTEATLADLATIDADPEYSFWYYASAAPGPQLELKFTDTASDGYVEVTLMPAQGGACVINTWTKVSVLAASGRAIWYGEGETGTAFDWENNAGVYTLADVEALINAETGVDTASDWVLTRVRAELWEAGTRTCYIDDITIDGTTYYGLIQDAVDSASSNDIISVGEGTYEESTIHVHTTENLTIESVAGADTTIISGTEGTNKLFEIGGHTGNTADGFVLDGFTLTGTFSYGVYMYVRRFDIKNNIIVGPTSDGIDVTNPTTGPPTAITSGNITGNTITGLGADAMEYRPGILLEANDAAGAAISGIIISNNTVSGFGTTTFGEEAAGIRCASVHGMGVVHDITITGNILTGNRIGLHIYGSCTGLDIYSNNMTANKDGVVVCNSATDDIASTFNLYNNTITSNTRYGVYFLKTASESITGAKKIMYNTISGNTIAGILSDFTAGTAPVATYNYWGTAAGPYHATTNPGVIAEMGNAVSSYVTYIPWLYLTDETDDGDTVANIYDNSVPAYAGSVVLSSGWNTFSVPIALDGQYNSWAELYTLTSANYTVAYRFDSDTQTFMTLATTSTYALAPGEGFYIKMADTGSIPYCYSTEFSIPSRDLSASWNLIGGGMTTRTEIASCASIVTAGGTAGYTHIISPAENEGAAWVYIAGAADSAGSFVAGEGYWVFLPIDRTLGLFDLTPVTWVPIT